MCRDFDMNKKRASKRASEQVNEQREWREKNEAEENNRIVQQKFYRFGYQLNDQPHSAISDAEMILLTRDS